MAARRRRNKHSRGQGATAEFPRLLGGRLCLDFVNTVEDPLSAEPEDFLHDYADLLAWTHHAGVLEEARATRLHRGALAEPERARLVFARALALRGSIERVFRRLAAGVEPPPDDVERIQSEYLEALRAASLTRSGAGYAWSWNGADDLRSVLWPIVESAVDLLTNGDLKRVRQCPGAHDCGWLFYDASRNATRRWCSMEGCGSRVKMRRQYAKRRVQLAT
jgi:predicted RNA-binding Zn ribbon-like protein